MLGLINATVSHELRNPLNSIQAQNIANKAQFDKLDQILQSQISETSIRAMKEIVQRLKQDQLVSLASTKVMKNIIQDMLDYAQIKAGKFRQNLKTFNVKTTIEEIISIQKR